MFVNYKNPNMIAHVFVVSDFAKKKVKFGRFLMFHFRLSLLRYYTN